MATRIGQGKVQFAAVDGQFSKTLLYMQKSRRCLLHKLSYSSFLSQISLPREWVGVKFNWQHSIAYPWNLPYRRENFADIFFTKAEI